MYSLNLITNHRLYYGHEFDWDNAGVLDVENFYKLDFFAFYQSPEELFKLKKRH